MKKKQHHTEPFWNWGKGLTAVILAFVLSTLGVVVYISSLEFHLVSENHYENAVEYQQQIDRMARSNALENEVQISRIPGSRVIRILFPDSLFPLRPTGSITLYRPSNAGLDRTFDLVLDDEWSQLIPYGQFEDGRWLVQISWQAAGVEYYKEVEIFL